MKVTISHENAWKYSDNNIPALIKGKGCQKERGKIKSNAINNRVFSDKLIMSLEVLKYNFKPTNVYCRIKEGAASIGGQNNGQFMKFYNALSIINRRNFAVPQKIFKRVIMLTMHLKAFNPISEKALMSEVIWILNIHNSANMAINNKDFKKGSQLYNTRSKAF